MRLDTGERSRELQTAQRPQRVLRFGDLEIDEGLRELRRAGRAVRTQPKVFDLLLYLAAHPDRVVTRDELLDSIWPDTVVTDASLARAVREVRRAIGDDGAKQSIIRTVRGHGFRFVPPPATPASRAFPRALSSSRPPAGDPPIVGRDRELELVAAHLRAAERGRGAAFAVLGEPGIGKSTFLDAIAELARGMGFPVARTRARHDAQSAPLSLWLEVAADLGIADAVRAMPAPDERIGAFRAALERSARERPIVLLLDDVDRADSESRRLLESVASNASASRVVLVVAWPTHGAHEAALADAALIIARSGPQSLIELGPLGERALGVLAQRTLDRAPSPAGLSRLARLSGGHPLYARYLLSAVRRNRRALETLDRLPRAERGLSEVVRRRLAQLPRPVREVVDAGSVLGVPLTVPLVAQVADARPAIVADSLREAQERGLLAAATDDAFDFVHGIVRRVAQEELAPSHRALLHSRAARALERTFGRGSDVIEMLAEHAVLGALVSDASHALELCRQAADLASTRAAHDVAAHHLRNALQVEAHLPAGTVDPRVLWNELGLALARDGQIEKAGRAFARAGHPGERGPFSSAVLAISCSLPRLVERFYEVLFERNPELRALFVRNHPKVQQRMFGETLAALARHDVEEEWLDAHLRDLGGRHLEYGVTPEMYPSVRSAFLAVLEEGVGAGPWPAEVRDAWADALDRLAERMLAGAPADPSPP